MKVALIAAVLLCGAAALAVRVAAPARAQAPQTLVLRVGDRLVVDGAKLGCQVIERGGRPVIDCRRGGNLRGTYGTMAGRRPAGRGPSRPPAGSRAGPHSTGMVLGIG